MPVLRRLLGPLLLALSLTPALAHPEWKQASATGVIDDQGRFTLTVKFDVPSYLVGKIPKEATVEELDELMLTPDRFTSASRTAPDKFLKDVAVLADGKPLTVRLSAFPSASEIRAQSVKQGEADRYPVLLNAHLETRLPPETRRVSLRLPPELGTTFANLRKGMEFQVVMALPAGETGDFIIRDDAPVADAPAPWYGNAGRYAVELLGDGFGHVIPEGWDHCLFMMAMFLGAASLSQALSRSLVFTVGHSITLSLVALGLIPPVGAWIEPFIALTIGVGGTLAYLGRASARQMLIVPAVFGLVHGLGFAAAVSDRLGEWDRASLVKLLVGFNLGVEAAQVLVIVVTAGLLALLARTPLPRDRTRSFLCLAVAVTGFGVMLYRAVELLA